MGDFQGTGASNTWWGTSADDGSFCVISTSGTGGEVGWSNAQGWYVKTTVMRKVPPPPEPEPRLPARILEL